MTCISGAPSPPRSPTAADDLTALGRSVGTGRRCECDRHISRAWPVLHTHDQDDFDVSVARDKVGPLAPPLLPRLGFRVQ